MIETPFRHPPANIEAEQSLLGAALVNNETYFQAADIITADDFYEPLHRRIFEAVGTIIGKGRIADPVTLAPHFENDPAIREVGGTEYLVRLNASAINTINVRDYARTIADLSILRGLIGIGEEVVNAAYEARPDDPPAEQIERAERWLYELAETGKYGQGFTAFLTSAKKAIEMAEAAFKRASRLSGLATGLADLDALTGGLQSSDLIVLAGRPAMGKTSLATNIAAHVAIHEKKTVGFFSLEMSGEQLAMRIIAERAGIPSHHMRRGKLTAESFRPLVKAVADLESMPLHIDDTGGLSIAALAARARRLRRQIGLDLLVVDYIQLLQPAIRRTNASRVNEVTEITQGLKALAKELNVPILALSQLSRAVENREDKRPQLADLRESGSIEQDADVVMFVYREEYYHDMRKPDVADTDKIMKWEEKAEKVRGLAEIIVGKQRHGPVGTVNVHFNAELTSFRNLVRE